MHFVLLRFQGDALRSMPHFFVLARPAKPSPTMLVCLVLHCTTFLVDRMLSDIGSKPWQASSRQRGSEHMFTKTRLHMHSFSKTENWNAKFI
jgi:hypothetical protein